MEDREAVGAPWWAGQRGPGPPPTDRQTDTTPELRPATADLPKHRESELPAAQAANKRRRREAAAHGVQGGITHTPHQLLDSVPWAPW